MKYFVSVGARTLEVQLDGSRVTVDGGEAAAQLAAVPGTPLCRLTLDGVSWTLAVEARPGVGAGAGAGRWAVGVEGEWLQVDVVDERSRALAAAIARRPAAAEGGVLVAPMPGLVVRVEVREGQRVDAGAGLVVIEAMKMENELRAAHGGVVTRVHVQAGAAVEKGAALVTLTSAEPQG